MPLWGKNDQANNAPKFRVVGKKFKVGDVAGRTKASIANTYLNVASSSMVVTVLAADKAEAKAVNTIGKLTHPGWIVLRQYTGPVQSITIVGGTGYTNGNIITVSNGTINATATVTTNGTGNAASAAVTVAGQGFINTGAIAVAVANSTGGATGAGSGATITVTLGGRAGRKVYETLVAMGTIAGDGADDALLPDS